MKNNILDAWIMVEHLSEGDISLKDKKNLRLYDLTDKKYYDYFNSLVEKENIRRYNFKLCRFGYFTFTDVQPVFCHLHGIFI